MNKDFVVKLLDDKTVPITHKRTCLKKYYEYYLEIDKTIADEIINLIKEHNNSKHTLPIIPCQYLK